MIILHRHSTVERMPLGKRAIYNGLYAYYGWTGFEQFGVIRSYRYFGWGVTCWATATAAAYGNAHKTKFFGRFDDAVRELETLMDVAESIGLLAHKRVRYANFAQTHNPFRFLQPISSNMMCDPRVPWSPAHVERLRRLYDVTKPYPCRDEAELVP